MVFHAELKGDVDFEKRSAKKAGAPWGTKELRAVIGVQAKEWLAVPLQAKAKAAKAQQEGSDRDCWAWMVHGECPMAPPRAKKCEHGLHAPAKKGMGDAECPKCKEGWCEERQSCYRGGRCYFRHPGLKAGTRPSRRAR